MIKKDNMKGKKICLLGLVLMLLCLLGCRSARYVPVPEWHTLYKTRADTVQRWDSVYFRDSVTMAAKGDTVYLTKTRWRERFRNVYHVKVDTIMQRDSVRVPYPVEKPLTKWQRWKMDLGGWAMGVAAGMIIVVVILAVLRVGKVGVKIL